MLLRLAAALMEQTDWCAAHAAAGTAAVQHAQGTTSVDSDITLKFITRTRILPNAG